MAGDWLKMEVNTPDKPEVVGMATVLKLDQDAVLGKLFRVWAWADQNSVAGESMIINEAFLDRLTNQKGFSRAMRTVGWLEGNDGCLSFPNFSRHNGATAKARAMDNRKKASQRQRDKQPELPGTNVPPASGQMSRSEGGTKPGPEKRREEYTTHSLPTSGTGSGNQPRPQKSAPGWDDVDFAAAAAVAKIVRAYPANGNRMEAEAAVHRAIAAGESAESIAAKVQVHAERFAKLSPRDQQYAPGLATYFAEKRWNDSPDLSPWKRHAPVSRQQEEEEAKKGAPKKFVATIARAPKLSPIAASDRPTTTDFAAAKASIATTHEPQLPA